MEDKKPQIDTGLEPLLETIVESNDQNAQETNGILEHNLQQNSRNGQILENQLEILDGIHEELKKPKPEIPEVSLEETNTLLKELTEEVKKKEEYTYDIEIDPALKEQLKGEQGIPGENGKDGHDGKDGQDGKDGKDGQDGQDGTPGKKGDKGDNGSPDSAEDIVTKLESLEKEKRLSYDSIKDTPDIPKIIRLANQSSKTVSLSELDDVDLSGLSTVDGKYVLDSSDEKVKYNASDTSAGYLADKVIAGAGITLSEGTGPDADKLEITNTLDLTDYFNKVSDDTDDITDTATNRFTDDTAIARLANTSGTNTGDQNLTGYLQNNIGIAGGTTLIGGTASGENLTLKSTSHATKGKILFGTSAYDEVNNNLYIGKPTGSYKLDVYGTGTTGGINTNIGLNFKKVTPPNSATPTYTYSAGGNVDIGTHYYHYKYYTAVGDTDLSGYGTAVVTGTNKTVNIANIPVSSDPSVIGRKIFRSKVGESTSYGYLVDTIADNTTTTYVDTKADSALGVAGGNYGQVNTTNRLISINGVQALMLDTFQTVMGQGAGVSLTTGLENTLLGGGAGSSVTTGNGNVYFGGSRGSASGSGNFGACGAMAYSAGNFCIGIGAYNQGSTTGQSNITFGYACANALTSGANNIMAGFYTGSAITTGGNNVLLGSYAMSNAGTSSADNVSIGYFTGRGGAVVGQNVFIGSYAGTNTGTSYNTMVGYGSGHTNTTGTSNVFLGNCSGYYETGSNKFFVDNQTRTNEATARTSSLMYGVFDATVANQTLQVNAGLIVNGSMTNSYLAKTANYTFAVNDYLVNATANSFDLTLPTAVGITGKQYVLKNSGTGIITVKTTSSQTIDGVASGVLTLVQWDSLKVMSDGANWLII